MQYFVLFVFGSVIGSFLNVISLRYKPNQKLLNKKIIGGRSHCLNCNKKLTWYELIPIVSFLLQFGKCRKCGKRLSFQYPIVEVLSGLIFVFVPFILTNNFQFTFSNNFQTALIFCWLLIFSLFILLSIIDIRYSIIPNSLNLSLTVLGFVLIIIKFFYEKSYFLNGYLNNSFLGHYAPVFGLERNIWFNHLFAALVGLIFFGLIIFLSKGKAMGMGDFKLVFGLGLIFGWPDILMVLLLSFIVGSLISVFFMIIKKKKMKDPIPFGPFLAIGSFFTFFFGYQIIDWYFKIFGL
ncbi:prepilin peptidase [Candidatus Wolfebacteria bacterium]|nr:prepilin peptidase [Candidatus Wolfebacteria bacterium]